MRNHFNAAAIRRDFSRAAVRYDAHADLQQTILRHVLSLLPRGEGTLLDAGCGTGMLLPLIKNTHQRYKILGLDFASSMCRQASMRGMPSLCADLEKIPLKDRSMEAVICASVLQWIDDRAAALAELRRVTGKGGTAVIAVFSHGTLEELRQAFSALEPTPRISEFPTQQSLANAAHQAGWHIREQSEEIYMRYYTSLRKLMQELKALGATNKRSSRRRGLTTLSTFRRAEKFYRAHHLVDQGLASSWHVTYLVLENPS